MSSSEIEELKKQLALFQAAAPDIADKVREYEEQQRIEREEEEKRERYAKIISNIPLAIEYIKGLDPDENKRKIVKDVLELAFEKIKNQEERIQDLEEYIEDIEEETPSYEFKHYSLDERIFDCLSKNLNEGEYIISKIYDILSIKNNSSLRYHYNHISYITNFGNIVTIDSYLFEILEVIYKKFNDKNEQQTSTKSIIIYLQRYNLMIPGSVDERNKILFNHLLGTNLDCKCFNFINECKENMCGNDCYIRSDNSISFRCFFPFLKWECNSNQELNDEIINKIKKTDFNVTIPNKYNLDKNYQELSTKYSNNQNTVYDKFLEKYEEYNFCRKLKENVSSFIQNCKNDLVKISNSIPHSQPSIEIPIAEPVLGIPETVSTEVLKNAAEHRRDNIRNRIIRRKRYESKSGGSSGNLLRWNIG